MTLKNFSKYIIIIIISIFTNKAFAENSLAYLDLDFIMKKSVAGVSIVNQLNDLKKKNVGKLKKVEQDLKDKEDKLNSQKNILSPEDLEKKVISLRKEIY